MTNLLQTIDYDMIFRELIKGRRSYDDVSQTTRPPNLAAYLSEYSTFWIGTSRQRGKTAWVQRLLQEEPASAMLTVNTALVRVAKQQMGENAFDRSVMTLTDAVRELHSDNPPRRELKLVIVDEARYTLDGGTRSEFYRWVARNGSEDTIVLMVTN